jgi:hypothetical protein
MPLSQGGISRELLPQQGKVKPIWLECSAVKGQIALVRRIAL